MVGRGAFAQAGGDEFVVRVAGGVYGRSEQQQDRVRGLPRPVDAAEQRRVPGPRKAVQLRQGRHQTGPQRVEVNVAEHFQQIGFFFDKERLEAVLKDVACLLVPAVEADGVAGVEGPHEVRQRGAARPEQEVEVIR